MAKTKSKEAIQFADPAEQGEFDEIGLPDDQCEAAIRPLTPQVRETATDMTQRVTATISTAIVEVPLGEEQQVGSYMRVVGHVDVQLNKPEVTTLRRLVAALRKRNDTYRGGKPIVSGADAMRWLLEQIGGGE